MTFWGLLPRLPSIHDEGAPHERRPHKHLTTRQGHPVFDNQNQRTIGDRGPATLENYHFLEKIGHFDRERIPERVVHARGATAFGYFEATGKVGDEPISKYTRAKLFQEAGKRTDVALRFSTVAGGRDSSEAAARPARLRGEVLHRGRQLGPRRQQPRRLLHPRRDQVPGLHPLPEARPGHLRAPGRQPRLRLHLAVARVAAHGHAGLRPARHPGVATGPCRASASTPTSGSTRPARPMLVKYHWHPKQGVKSLDRGRRRRHAGRDARRPHQGPLRRDRARRLPGVGPVRPADGATTTTPSSTSTRSTTRRSWPENDFPLRHVGTMVAQPRAGELLRRERADRVRHRRPGRRPGLLRRQDARRPDVLLLRHAALPRRPELPAAAGQRAQEAARRDQPARRRDGLLRRRDGREPARQLRAVDHRRARARRRSRRTPSRARSIEGRLTRARIPRTNDYKQAGERYLLSEQWERDDLVANLIDACSASATARSRSGWSGTCSCARTSSAGGSATASASPPTTSAASSRWRRRCCTDEEQRAPGEPRQQRPARRRPGLEMTHCVPNEHVAVAEGSAA